MSIKVIPKCDFVLPLLLYFISIMSFKLGRTRVINYVSLQSSSSFSSHSDYMLSDDYMMRFNNIAKLYPNQDALQRLHQSVFCIIGVGGVGSWAAEALARSGVGNIVLIDLDDICISNINRQSHALSSTIGKMKVNVVRDKILDINPYANVECICEFATESTVNMLLTNRITYVLDCCDSVNDKVHIIDSCVRNQIPIVISGGAAGLTDPTSLRISDIASAEGDNLIMRVRKKLRQQFGYPSGSTNKLRKPWNILAVHTEPTGFTRGEKSLISNECNLKTESSWRKCDGNLGNACFITGTVGFFMASVAVTAVATGQALIPLKLSSSANPIDFKDSQITGYNNDTNTSNTQIVSSLLNQDLSNIRELYMQENLKTEVSKYDNTSEELEFPLVDSHCHLQLQYLSSNIETVIQRAIQCDVGTLVSCAVCPGTDWEKLIEIFKEYPRNVLPQFGLHPWYINKYYNLQDNTIIDGEKLMQLRLEFLNILEEFPNCGIGEAGLDKSIKRKISLSQQHEVLRVQIELAVQYKRVLTLHCVASWGSLLEAIRRHDSQKQIPFIILHSCNSLPIDFLKSYLEDDRFYFSFNAKQLGTKESQLLKRIPVNRLLIESDSPDQIPNVFRDIGIEYNEPAFVRYTCFEISKILGISARELALVTRNNNKRIYEFHA